MESRQGRRRLALTLRAAGLAFMVGALGVGLLHTGVGSALAQVMPVPGLGTPVPESTATPNAAPNLTPTPVPTVRPSPTPRPSPGVVRGGPLTISLSGSLSLGQSSRSTLFGDASAGTQSQDTTSTTTGNAGMMAQLSRRTASTTLTFGIPIGLALRNAYFGELVAGYYTPKYGLLYGSQAFSLLGGVPLGSTLRGFGLLLPLSGGDLTLYRGPAYGPQEELLDVTGLRARSVIRDTLLEFGLDSGRSKQGSKIDALMFGAARSSGLLSQTFESAFERINDPNDPQVQRGDTYQYRADYGGDNLYGSMTLRRNSDGFVSFGGGAVVADSYVDGSLRTTIGSNSLYADEAVDSSGVGSNATLTRRGSFNFSHLFERMGTTVALSLTDESREYALGRDWTGSAGAQLGFTLFNINTALGAQLQRTTYSYGLAQATGAYSANLQRQVGPYALSGSYASVRQIGTSSGLQSTTSFALTRNFGLTGLTFTDTSVHIVSSLTDSVQQAPTISLSRRLSPVATLALTYGIQQTRDVLNPADSGHSRIFSVQLAAPFAIGSGLVQGRANPNLPATISGMVTSELATQGAFAAAASIGSGVANVEVVLDDTQIQRTDLSGHFQFNFVSSGRHTLRIESSSLPRGVTPDQPIASVQVLGGQIAQINFQIGSFGGIEGHVLGRDENGQPVGIPGVVLTLDGTAGLTTTGPDGWYGFGRLNAGTHVVAVQTSSLPATSALSTGTTTQKVQVQTGEIATLDFAAKPLGSIAGFVMFDPSLAPLQQGPVMNAYVVAEPGDFAAITNEDGSFLLDNIPSGTYSVDLDPETVPEDTANIAGPQTITVSPDQHIQGVRFLLAHKSKAVIFSFKTTQAAAAAISLDESRLPPGGATPVSVDAGAGAKSVALSVFGERSDLVYDKRRKLWVGMLIVPLSATAGTQTITADVKGAQNVSAFTELKVDPAISIATFSMTPRRPVRGEYVTVRARFLADVRPGDQIHWVDGQITKLSHAITGRVFQFTVKISEQPLRGLLLTRQGELPITLR